MDLKYSVTFHTYWHCGSGLAAGADVDLLVIKDRNGLPFIPGKTIKGLFREAVDEINSLQAVDDKETQENYFKVFGQASSVDSENELQQSETFFSNVELLEKEQNEIVAGQLVDQMYDGISQTAIKENGTADDHSLRRMEVVIPCKLYGVIVGVPEQYSAVLKEAMGFIKYLGQGRNRGLGRCTIEMED